MHLLRQSVGISFLCLSAQIFCMETGAGLSYFQAVKQIDANNQKCVQNFLKHVCTTDVVLGIEVVKEKLQLIRQNLADSKEQLFAAYKKWHGVSDEEWNRCVQETQIFDHYIQQNNNNFNFSYIVHDSRIPAGFMSTLKKSLERNGINPKAVSLITVEHRNFNVFFFDYGDSDKKQSCIEIIPGLIGVNLEYIENFSQEAQEGLCAFLAYSIKGDCFLTERSSDDEMWKKVLSQYMYSSSLFTLALNNDGNNAQLLKALCNEVYNSVFSIDDYQLLSDICYLHEVLASLKSMQYNARFNKQSKTIFFF